MPLSIGTCSWNYDSWLDLVYSSTSPTASGYLPEYSTRYRTTEIDSWFYKMPTSVDVREYMAAVDPGFVFTCKAPQDLTLTMTRGNPPQANPAFLSPELFSIFHDRIAPMGSQIGAIMLEFEYLNRAKMPGQEAFMNRLAGFAAAVPRDIPIAIECRNGPWLNEVWFSFLKDHGLSMVFSEKQYLPRIVDLYAKFGHTLASPVIIRLLGGDRAAIEKTTGQNWSAIVDPKPELPAIAAMIAELTYRDYQVFTNVNNHFEGSAPLTIGRLQALLAP